MIAPKGIATRQVGRMETLATNHSWSTNSRHWTGRLNAARAVSSDIAAKLPASRKTHLAGMVAIDARAPKHGGPGRPAGQGRLQMAKIMPVETDNQTLRSRQSDAASGTRIGLRGRGHST